MNRESIMMRESKLVRVALIALGVVAGAGCMPRMDIQAIKQMQPERPAELDRLDMLLGEWETSGEVRMAVLDEVLSVTGSNSATWELDKRMLVERAELDMGELGKMTGMSIWWWDARARRFRMWWFDSFGEISEAAVRYDEASQTWHMSAKGQKYGHATSGRGTLRRIDENTLAWTWNEYDALGLIKLATMKGTSHRK